MTPKRRLLQELNSLDQAAWTAALGGIFEHSPWIAAETWPQRPFASLDELQRALQATMFKASAEQQVALIRAHPDLAGKAAIAGDLTQASASEQASAGLDRLSPNEFAAFTRLNTAYRETFDFPFVICVREHSKQSILDNFATRLQHSREQELATALGEIGKIAALRLHDLIATEPETTMRGRLTTHVLDTAQGRPGAGIAIELWRLDAQSEQRELITTARTNPDGRTDAPLLAGEELTVGSYELVFAVGAYFASQPVATSTPPFLDRIPLRFGISDAQAHYHVPLLVSPWAYSTYRGS